MYVYVYIKGACLSVCVYIHIYTWRCVFELATTISVVGRRANLGGMLGAGLDPGFKEFPKMLVTVRSHW